MGDNMSKETLKNLIELVPDKDIETIYQVVIRFIPEVDPMGDEIESIENAKESSETVSHNEINWD